MLPPGYLKALPDAVIELIQEMEDDKYGNSTGTTLSADSNSSAGKIVTSAKYSDDGTQMTSQTDASGSTTTYTYNTQRTVSSQADAKGTTNYHSYFAESGRPKTNYITDVISAGYEYSCGNLVAVRRSGYITSGGTKQTQYYNMGYDSFGNMTSISVGSRELASYDYGSQNGNLRSMTYGNGATVSYTYDSLDRVTEEKWGDTLKYQYFYNAEGDLAKKLDVTTGKAVNYEYDSLDRLIHSYQTDNDVVQQRTEHLYDTENRLTSQSWQLGSTPYKESFTYSDKDGSLTEVGLEGAAGYRFTYDALKRLSYLTNGVYKKSYTYTNVADGQTSTQVARVRYAADNSSSVSAFSLNYTYDEVGNISAITTGFARGAASYTYDQQGQLTQETNYYGTNTYTYDTYGNIRSETRKPNSGTTTTYEYGYEDTNGWLDLLTSYRGHSISYDAWGRLLNSSTNQIFKANPIRYRGYYYDTESGLYYLGSRYYDPQVKRFINADGYASTGQGFVGCNMFAYCGNNPIRFVDLNGCFWEEARDFFKNIYDNIGRIIGPDITVVYQSRTDDPDPTPECPLIIVSGEYATETLFEAGSSERIVTVQEQFRTDNIFESSIGIAINTGNYTWTYSKSFNSVSVGYTTEHRDQTYSKYFTVNLASRAPLSLTATVSSPSGRNMKTTGYIKVKASWDFIERCFQYTVGYPGAYIPALA